MWKKISSKTIFEHPRISLAEDIVELPDGSQTSYLKYQSAHDSASVICVRGNEVLLQKEYSYPPDEELYQFPGGKIEAGESPEEAAARELKEEAGLQAKQLTPLGWFYFDNRRSNAKLYIFLATEVSETAKQGGDAEEDITSHWTALEKVDQMIKTGEIHNITLMASWALYKAFNQVIGEK